MSRQVDKESISALIKLGVFLVFTGFVTLLLMNILANGLFRQSTEYHAVFRDVTGVAKGDDVRIAGVSVGKVKGIEIKDRNYAVVTFGVDPKTPLTENTHATLKFRNLVGQRYLALSQDKAGSQAVLKPGATIPADRTKDALDLNLLLNGFKPVFEALSPSDTNQLAFEIVQTLQGEAGNVQNVLAHTASLTTTLAERDELIGNVIASLSETLEIVGNRDAELSDTIITLQTFISGLKDDREAILGSIDSISGLANETSLLLQEGRPALVADIKALNELTKELTEEQNLAGIEQDLQILPFKMRKAGNAASSGSQFNFYLCGLTLELSPFPPLLNEGITLLGDLPAAGGARCER